MNTCSRKAKPARPRTDTVRPDGFTRLDLLAVVAGLMLLIVTFIPALEASKAPSEQASCLNNLRQIGRAFQLWGTDHGDERPWRVPQLLGGTMAPSGTPKFGNVWYEMACVSNELATPRILVCPSDEQVTRVATEFSGSANGGFLHPNYRANAVSYFIGLWLFNGWPRVPLSGDRNIRVDGVNAAENSGVNNAAFVFNPSQSSTVADWTNGVHEMQGNLLLNDGAVLRTRRAGLLRACGDPAAGSRQYFLMPR